MDKSSALSVFALASLRRHQSEHSRSPVSSVHRLPLPQSQGNNPAAAAALRWGHQGESFESTPWWPPRVVPPKGAPNVLLIMTDDDGFGARGPSAASSQPRNPSSFQ